MSTQLYLAFVAATVVLMLIPGPNVALIVANSVARGTRIGLLTVLGTSTAMVPQLLLTLLGMTAALTLLSQWFGWLRFVGVLYLLYLGVKQWRAKPAELGTVQAQTLTSRAVFTRGFLVSLTNPKTLLFYGAFFPQFVNTAAEVHTQFALLSATFLATAVLVDSTWAILGGLARPFLLSRATLHHRLSGSLLIGAALGLAMARKE